MQHPFVPLLALVVVPLCLLAWRLGLSRAGIARIAAVGVAGVTLASAWTGGIDFVFLERTKLFVALAAVAAIACRSLGVAGMAQRKTYLASLSLIAALAWVVFFNFFSFHGVGQNRVFIHLHDVAHYYLGAKYFPELGYQSIYTAMLRAEAERYDDHFRSLEVRDLATNGLVDIRVLLAQSDAVKARFTPERWAAFLDDLAYFRDGMGKQWGEVLRDHGFNPTPVWPLIGGALANLVPAGSPAGILALTLLDPVLLLVIFGAIAWAFGAEAMLLSSIYFCTLYGASFGWTGGGFLRYAWLACLVGGVCCLKRGRHATAGALLGVAVMLRIFPAWFVAPIALRIGYELATRQPVSARHVRFLLGVAASCAVLFSATLAVPAGLHHWQEFRQNMQRHVESDAYNSIGLNEILAYTGPVKAGDAVAFARELEWRQVIYRAQLALVALLMLGLLVRRSRWPDDVPLAVLGIPLLFCTLNLAAYYWAFLILLVLAHGRSPWRIALLFVVEALTRVLTLFEDREVVLFFDRNLLMAVLLLALYLDEFRAPWDWLVNRLRARSPLAEAA